VDGAVRDADKPFALFISHNPPHMPFHEVPPKYLETYADEDAAHLLNRPNVELKGDGARAPGSVKEYFAAITGIDEQFARILATLDEEGLTEDTIVIFTSDHGEMMGSHGLMGKDVWYDESLLVPFSIRWPNRISTGRDDLLLSTPDIMPTLLGLMELAGDIPGEVQGSNYAPAILGQPCVRPASAFYFYSAPQFPDKPGRRGVRTHRYTFVIIRHEEGDQLILHDNVQDPYQLENIAAHNPDVVEMLVQELNGWLHKTGDPWYPLERTYSR
jgi:N-acetylglucosamine-6-sulfatase